MLLVLLVTLLGLVCMLAGYAIARSLDRPHMLRRLDVPEHRRITIGRGEDRWFWVVKTQCDGWRAYSEEADDRARQKAHSLIDRGILRP